MERRMRRKEGGFCKRCRGAQCGFTLASTAISFTIAGVVLAGAWMAFAGMRTQWKIANAERMMDQYAASTMQELTNIMSWSWGGEPLSGGRNPRWKITIDDILGENNWRTDQWRYRLTDSGKGYHYVQLAYQAQKGILINNQLPGWTYEPRSRTNWYQWSGKQAGTYRINSFDRRDRMTIEGLDLEYDDFARFPASYEGMNGTSIEDQNKARRNVVWITLTMHYTYTAPLALGLFSSSYTRERIYTTQVYLRNWNMKTNPYYDEVFARG